jgi:Na+/melibiose symporter-like transporter
LKADERRYVGTKETISYVLFDASKGFSIDQWKNRFFLDVVKIDFTLNAIASIITQIWDIVDDSFAGILVDKTQTRWGKFRPYILIFAVPGTILTALYWLTPYFFGSNPFDLSKCIYWYGLGMITELMTTFRNFAETGYISSISPNPADKMRLFTLAEVISSIWENIPEFLMGLLIDFANSGTTAITLKTTYSIMGIICAVQAGAFALLYGKVAKERVMQSIKKPNLKESWHTIKNNKPMLLITVSEFFKAFKIDTGVTNYYVDVLGSAFLKNLVALPGSPISYFSYLYIGWVESKFSTKALWIFGEHEKDVTSILVYFFGIIGGKGAKGNYLKKWVMFGAFVAKDFIYKSTLSVYKIIPRMMQTQVLDYCEWKNGFRTEGATLAVKEIVKKVAAIFTNPINSLVLKSIGYSLTAGHGQQSASTKYYLFTMCTLAPGLTGMLGIIPKLFYDLSPEKKERMYSELAIRRAAKHSAFSDADISGEEINMNYM